MRLTVVVVALLSAASLGAQSSEFEPLYRRALSLREQQFGPQDQRTAESRLDLGLYLATQGNGDEAERIIEQAYDVLADSDPPNPARTADALEAWADLRLNRGDGAGGEALLTKALHLREPQDAQRGGTLDRLATLMRLRGKLDDAESLGREALRSGRTATRLRTLAIVLEAKGSSPEAEQLHLAALELQRVELGVDPETALTLNSLGLLTAERQDWPAATAYFEEAYEVFVQTLGAESPESATAMDNLGNIHRATGDFASAERLLRKALAVREQVLGADHPETAATLNNLAGLFHVQGRLDDAEPLYRASIAARTQAFGPDDPSAAETLYNLAHLLRQKGNAAAARQAFQAALSVLEKAYGAADPFVGDIRRALDGLGPSGRSESVP